jgi:hypothetical protein
MHIDHSEYATRIAPFFWCALARRNKAHSVFLLPGKLLGLTPAEKPLFLKWPNLIADPVNAMKVSRNFEEPMQDSAANVELRPINHFNNCRRAWSIEVKQRAFFLT